MNHCGSVRNFYTRAKKEGPVTPKKKSEMKHHRQDRSQRQKKISNTGKKRRYWCIYSENNSEIE